MFKRYAVYVTPTGELARKGAAWLGWDLAQAKPVLHPRITGVDLAALTQAARTYGFHGTVKPPMVLADGTDATQLSDALQAMCAKLAPVSLDRLQVSTASGFLSLRPTGDQTALSDLAAQVVTELDLFRAPPSEDELDRRRSAGLTVAQKQNLRRWGYPYVMDQFRFHLTLSGPIPPEQVQTASDAAAQFFKAQLSTPFVIDSLTLVGQSSAGKFQQIGRHPLTG